jgi:Tfp pilus assembly protein PilE
MKKHLINLLIAVVLAAIFGAVLYSASDQYEKRAKAKGYRAP